jgi:DNA-binding FadR family transcriptional regulator
VVAQQEKFKTNLLSPAYRSHSIDTFRQMLGCLRREDGPGAAGWMREHLNAIRQELKDIL